jgi:chemotaxis-related protein WspB
MLALTFQIGQERLALDVRRITEVVPRVRLEQPAGAAYWLAGLFVYRGQVVPVIDLHRLVGLGECPPHLRSRIILVPHSRDGEGRFIGLLAAQVADVREVEPPGPPALALTEPGQPDLGEPLVEEGRILRWLDVDRLLPEPARLQLALLPQVEAV